MQQNEGETRRGQLQADAIHPPRVVIHVNITTNREFYAFPIAAWHRANVLVNSTRYASFVIRYFVTDLSSALIVSRCSRF